MRFFLDTEFIESGPGKPIQLISIGIVSQDGDTFYAISSEFNPDDASDWVKENVISQLEPEDIVPRYPLAVLANLVKDWVLSLRDGVRNLGRERKPEFWGYYADYDWVVFCQMFGTMMDLPKGFPMYCRDLKQWCDDLGNPELPKQGKGEHNALADALWNKAVYDYLDRLELDRIKDV